MIKNLLVLHQRDAEEQVLKMRARNATNARNVAIKSIKSRV